MILFVEDFLYRTHIDCAYKCQGRDWWTPYFEVCLVLHTLYVDIYIIILLFLSCVCSICALSSVAIVLSPAFAHLVVVTKSIYCIH